MDDKFLLRTSSFRDKFKETSGRTQSYKKTVLLLNAEKLKINSPFLKMVRFSISMIFAEFVLDLTQVHLGLSDGMWNELLWPACWIKDGCKQNCIKYQDVFKFAPLSASSCLFYFLWSKFCIIEAVDFSGIQTRREQSDGEHADHFTAIMA